MSAIEVLPARKSLDELATRIKLEHEETREAIANALMHALAAGEAILTVRETLPGRKWTQWARENVPDVSLPVLQTYMRLARYKQVVLDNPDVQTIQQAQNLLRGLPRANHAGVGVPASPETKARATELIAEGLTPRAVADLLGVNESAVRDWTGLRNYHAERRQKKLRLNARREEARRQRAQTAARKRGGSLAESYAMAERFQDVIAQAHRETEDREARAALSRAGEHYRKMRDEIVRALGVTS